MQLLAYFANTALLESPDFGRWAINLVAFIFVLGILVFVHEFGHYAVAKLCGVRVEVFSLGFGKRLWGFRRGDTDYRISALPLGGYVKMSGENFMEARTGDPGEFTSHPRWQRFLIAIAGPAMNILLAIAVLTGVYMIHDEEPAYLSQPADIAVVLPGSPAAVAGIKPGDRITKIQAVENPTWQQVIPEVLINPGQPVDVTAKRSNEVFHAKIVPQAEGPYRQGYAGWEPKQPPLVGRIEPDLPAARAGIKVGDQIVALNGTPVDDMSQLIDMLQQAKSEPVRLTVLRDQTEQQFTIVPQLKDDGTGQKKYRIGFSPATKMTVQRLSFRDSYAKALASCKDYSVLLFRLVPRLIEGKNSIRQTSGPIGIMQAAGQAATEGWWTLMGFMSMLSVSLAVINLLPIPILDGGMVLMLLIEGALRRDIKLEIKERVYQAAFLFLILFFVVVTYYDVAKSFHS
jgi:regulator of sigma E protease